jgi:uncharacterized protein (TIGR00645 family)
MFILRRNGDLLGLLSLTDSALVASTVVMVATSSDDSLVSRLKEQAATQQMHWPGGLDASDLKLKLATSIAPISIHLLKIFLTPRQLRCRGDDVGSGDSRHLLGRRPAAGAAGPDEPQARC